MTLRTVPQGRSVGRAMPDASALWLALPVSVAMIEGPSREPLRDFETVATGTLKAGSGPTDARYAGSLDRYALRSVRCFTLNASRNKSAVSLW